MGLVPIVRCPTYGVAEKYASCIPAREFFRRYPEIKQRYFWAGKLWTQSYYVETIGNANEEATRAYVRDQLTEHEKREARSEQLSLFLNSVACGRVVYSRLHVR